MYPNHYKVKLPQGSDTALLLIFIFTIDYEKTSLKSIFNAHEKERHQNIIGR